VTWSARANINFRTWNGGQSLLFEKLEIERAFSAQLVRWPKLFLINLQKRDADRVQRGMFSTEISSDGLTVGFRMIHNVYVPIFDPDIAWEEPAEFFSWDKGMLLSGRILHDVAEFGFHARIGGIEAPRAFQKE